MEEQNEEQKIKVDDKVKTGLLRACSQIGWGPFVNCEHINYFKQFTKKQLIDYLKLVEINAISLAVIATLFLYHDLTIKELKELIEDQSGRVLMGKRDFIFELEKRKQKELIEKHLIEVDNEVLAGLHEAFKKDGYEPFFNCEHINYFKKFTKEQLIDHLKLRDDVVNPAIICALFLYHNLTIKECAYHAGRGFSDNFISELEKRKQRELIEKQESAKSIQKENMNSVEEHKDFRIKQYEFQTRVSVDNKRKWIHKINGTHLVIRELRPNAFASLYEAFIDFENGTQKHIGFGLEVDVEKLAQKLIDSYYVNVSVNSDETAQTEKKEEEKTMSTKSSFVSSFQSAGVRTGSKVASKYMHQGLLMFLEEIDPGRVAAWKTVLETDVGESIVSGGIALMLSNLPGGLNENQYIRLFAEEFRTRSLETLMTIAVEHGISFSQKVLLPMFEQAAKYVPDLMKDETFKDVKKRVETGDINSVIQFVSTDEPNDLRSRAVVAA